MPFSFFKNQVQRLWRDPFFRKSGLFFMASMLVASLNYLYYPILGRRLALQDFGDVQAVLSLWSQLATILGGFTLATVHVSANCDVAGECTTVVDALRRYALYTVGIGMVLLLLVASQVASLFHFSSTKLMFVLPVLLLTNILYTLRTGYLQGKGRFGAVSLGNIMVSAGRLLFAIFFISLGWRAFGALFGLIMAQACALIYVFSQTRSEQPANETIDFVMTRTRLHNELAYVGLVICSSFFITALYVTDVLFVKRYFPPLVAGTYSGISTVANIAFFVSGPITTVLLASLKRRDSLEQRRANYRKGMGLIFLVGGSILALFTFFPRPIINLFIGGRYLPYAHLLPWLGGAFFFASLANLSTAMGLALRRRRLIILAICGISLLLLLNVTRHASLDQIVQNFFVCDLLAALAAFACAWPDLRRRPVSSV